MKRFKFDWLVYAIIGLAALVFAILIMPSIAIINTEKFVSGIVAVGLLATFIYYVYRKHDKMKTISKEELIVTIIQWLLVLYLTTAAVLLIFDINIIGSDNLVHSLGRIIGVILWAHGIVGVIEELHNRNKEKWGFLLIYLAIILITIGCFFFFNVNLTFDTICWIIFVLLLIVFIFCLVCFILFRPRKKKENQKE